jgi:hypothetical protein
MVLSEQTKEMSVEDISALQDKVKEMNKTELKKYLKTIDPDMMGFNGKEGVDDGSDD